MNDRPLEALIRRLMFPVGIISAAFWAAGTNLLADWWYVAHGISVGDVLFAVWFLLALDVPSMRRRFVAAAQTIREHLALMSLFMTLLIVSTAFNAFRFGAQWTDLLAILRLAYFVAIIVFTIDFVRQYGSWPIVLGFLAGVAALAGGRLYDAMSGGALISLFGLPLLKDPNVIGNMLGVGTFLASFGVLAGHVAVPLAFAVGFVVISAYTFSKGAWLMCGIGMLANFIALAIKFRLDRRGRLRLAAAVTVLSAGLAVLAYRNADTLTSLWSFKRLTTTDSETASYRYKFAIAGTYAMFDYPVFGLGFRNYGETLRLYPDVMPEPSENAHNLLIQIGAVAGLPALAVFLVLFWYPFPQLWRTFWITRHPIGGTLYAGVALLVFAVSGAVQLQIIAQPFFWFFTAIVRAWRVAGATDLT